MAISCKMEDDFKKQIIIIINNVVNDTFSSYFSVNMTADKAINLDTNGKELLCTVDMNQDDIKASLHFSFDSNLLYSLISNIYPADLMKDPDTCNDAACEIANIICCNVKAFLNKNGYNLNMDIPYTTDINKISEKYCDNINMHFSLNKDLGFSVNLFTSNNETDKCC